MQGIMDILRTGDTVALRGFGSFRLRHRPSRVGRNPNGGHGADYSHPGPVVYRGKSLPSTDESPRTVTVPLDAETQPRWVRRHLGDREAATH